MIKYNGEECTAKELCEKYLQEKVGVVIDNLDYEDWMKKSIAASNLDVGEIQIMNRNQWEDRTRARLQKSIRDELNLTLAERFPGGKNRHKRVAFRKTDEYKEEVKRIVEERIYPLVTDSMWENAQEEMRIEGLNKKILEIERQTYRLIKIHNEAVVSTVVNTNNIDAIMEDVFDLTLRDMQHDLDKWLKTGEVGFYHTDEDELMEYPFCKEDADFHYISLDSIGYLADHLCCLSWRYEQVEVIFGCPLEDYATAALRLILLPDGNDVANVFATIVDKYEDMIIDMANDAADKLDVTEEHVLECLSNNPRYSEVVIRYKEKKAKEAEEARLLQERLERIKTGILATMPDNYPDLFPLARVMKRNFVLHIGPTNSGKTYSAMQAMREIGEGIYLAPLRLLAFEQFETLNADGFLCNLITGEEQDVRDGAKMQASTVEMLDLTKEYRIAVIDEAQMIADGMRGWAWTNAILGIRCPEVHICASPDAEGRLIRLIEECGDTYEIVCHERQTKLTPYMPRFDFPDGVKKNDALIVFSRQNVHAVTYELEKAGHPCSIIYGNLPYDVRQTEAKKFAAGETEVLVATDAIGMGLNLPIKRVVFLEISKYDGTTRRMLKPQEAKQIAGRAGRLGIFDEGLYTSAIEAKTLKKLVNKEVEPLAVAVMGFPESLISLDGKLSEIMDQWMQTPVPEGYSRMDMSIIQSLVKELEAKTNNKHLIYKFATMPINPEKDEKTVWDEMVRQELGGKRLTLERAKCIFPLDGSNLTEMEQAYKICDLLYNYDRRFEHSEDIKAILKLKKDLSHRIMKQLSAKSLQPRRCKYCGKTLPWNYPYGICEECHDSMYPRWSCDDWDY